MTVPRKDLHGAPGRYCAETSGYVVLNKCAHLISSKLTCTLFHSVLRRPSAHGPISQPPKCEQCLAAQKGARA